MHPVTPNMLEQYPIDHIAYVTDDLGKLRSQFESEGWLAIDVPTQVAEKYPKDSRGHLYLGQSLSWKSGSQTIWLMEPMSRGPLLDYLKKHSPGLHHFGLEVEDIDKEAEKLEKEGYRLTRRPQVFPHDNQKRAILDPKTTRGILIELLQTYKVE